MCVAVDADSIHLHLHHLAGDGNHFAGLRHPDHAVSDHLRIVQHRAFLLARDEVAVVLIGAVGKHFECERQSRGFAGGDELGIRQHDKGQIAIHRLDASGDGTGRHVVLAGDIGNRSMGLHMGDLIAFHRSDALQRADLIGDQVLDFECREADDGTASEAMQVVEARMRAYAAALVLGHLHDAAHGVGIAGVKAAGDIDRGGKLNHGGVIAHFPWTKAFAEIAIEIDGHDGLSRVF